ncbi:MAG: tetratricopeptide repeat protein [Pseudomonadota bacterium]
MEIADPAERLRHLDAMMAGLYFFKRGKLDGLSNIDLDSAAKLKVEAIELAEITFKPNDDMLSRAVTVRDQANQSGDIIAEAFATSALAEGYMVLGRADDMEIYLQDMYELQDALSWPKLERDIIRMETSVFKMRGDTVQALTKSEELIAFYLAHDEPDLAALEQNSIANVLYDLGNYEAALEHYRFALAQIDQSKTSLLPNVAVLLKNAGSALTDLSRHAEAIPYYERALTIDETMNNGRGVAYTKFWMAKSLHALGQSDRALSRAQESVALSAQYSNPLQTASIRVWLAERYLERDEPALAETSLSKAAAILELDPGEQLEISLDGTDKFWAVSYARSMASVMSQMGKPVEALRYAEYALASHADWLEAEKVKAAVDAETLFEIRSKDQAIQLLESETQLQKAQIALRDSALARQWLRTIIGYVGAASLAIIAALAVFAWRKSRRLAGLRETLVLEEHHRTKNVLQLASGLAHFSGTKGVSQRLFAMGLVYQHLHAVENESQLDAEPFLTALVDYLSEALAPEGVHAELECDASTLSADMATPVGLIVCEAIINAYKHAFPQKSGKIEVSLKQGDRGLILKISDNGVGDRTSKLARSGKGWQLIEDLAAQLKAVARFQQDSLGSTWTIEPIPSR